MNILQIFSEKKLDNIPMETLGARGSIPSKAFLGRITVDRKTTNNGEEARILEIPMISRVKDQEDS